MRVKLTDAQLVIMSAAAQRENRCLELPDTMRGAVVGKVSAKLLKLGLVREIRAKAGIPVWRRDEAGVEHQVAAPGTILDCIGDQPGRLDGRMHRELLHPIAPDTADARVVPYIATGTPRLADPE
jgi:hypothetical protein